MKNTKTYIFYEIGDSCWTEFMLKDGEFHTTKDAVVIGIVKGMNAKDALRNLKRECSWIKKYRLDRLVAREVGEAVYL